MQTADTEPRWRKLLDRVDKEPCTARRSPNGEWTFDSEVYGDAHEIADDCAFAHGRTMPEFLNEMAQFLADSNDVKLTKYFRRYSIVGRSGEAVGDTKSDGSNAQLSEPQFDFATGELVTAETTREQDLRRHGAINAEAFEIGEFFQKLKPFCKHLRSLSRAPIAGGSSGVDGAPVAEAQGVATGRKRGPKPNLQMVGRVAEIVARVAPDRDLRGKLDDVCEALDEGGIPVPRGWPQNHQCRSWVDGGAISRDLAIKAIEYRLNTAKHT